MDIDSDDLDTELLARGVEVIAGTVPRPDAVRVIIARDFVQAVRDRVDDPEYAAADGAERLFGRACAKAIGQQDGSTDLVMDAFLLSPSEARDDHDTERTFHHEALHIAVDQRGEQISDLRLRHGYETNSNRGYFGAVTGVMIEEYRTERALCETGRWPHDDYLANFGAAVRAFADAAWDGVCNRYPGEPIDRRYETVVNAFHQLATYTGYVAAEILACGRSRAPNVDAAMSGRLLGAPWEAVVNSLNAIPSASTPIDPAALEALAWTTADHVEHWLEHVGFTLTDRPEGGAYFAVLRHDFQQPFG